MLATLGRSTRALGSTRPNEASEERGRRLIGSKRERDDGEVSGAGVSRVTTEGGIAIDTARLETDDNSTFAHAG